jgi:cytochrome c
LLGAALLCTFGVQLALADGPTAAERGNDIFQGHCSTCHGDRGQGLDEWRKEWDPAHQNCTQSKCHGDNHPPDGFRLPNNFAPKIIGDNTLTDLKTAQDLYNFISKKMPFQAPGSLTPDEYWLLASFLTNQHNSAVTEVNAQNATSISLHPSADPISSQNPYIWIGGLGLGIVFVGGVIAWWRRRH